MAFLARSALKSIVLETCPDATQQRTASSEQRAAMGSLETRASKGACVTERQGWHECLRRIQAASQSAAAGIQTSHSTPGCPAILELTRTPFCIPHSYRLTERSGVRLLMSR